MSLAAAAVDEHPTLFNETKDVYRSMSRKGVAIEVITAKEASRKQSIMRQRGTSERNKLLRKMTFDIHLEDPQRFPVSDIAGLPGVTVLKKDSDFPILAIELADQVNANGYARAVVYDSDYSDDDSFEGSKMDCTQAYDAAVAKARARQVRSSSYVLLWPSIINK